MSEFLRQSLHIGFGAFVIFFYTLFGKDATIKGLFIGVGVCIIPIILRFIPTFSPIYYKIASSIYRSLYRIERKGTFFARGAISYLIGALFLFCSSSAPFACGILCILAFGDGMSTLFGRWGRLPLPWNKEKSLEGLCAFFFFSFLTSFFFLGKSALFYSLFLAFIESQRIKIDDNILIPISGFILKKLFNI